MVKHATLILNPTEAQYDFGLKKNQPTKKYKPNGTKIIFKCSQVLSLLGKKNPISALFPLQS